MLQHDICSLSSILWYQTPICSIKLAPVPTFTSSHSTPPVWISSSQECELRTNRTKGVCEDDLVAIICNKRKSISLSLALFCTWALLEQSSPPSGRVFQAVVTPCSAQLGLVQLLATITGRSCRMAARPMWRSPDRNLQKSLLIWCW